MTKHTPHPNIPILTNLNWVLWRILIQGYLKQHDLYSFITSTVPVPGNAAKAKTFESRKTKASGILQQYMGMTNYQKFKSDKTRDEPRAMWLNLEGHYQSKVQGDRHGSVHC
jgi:hypothetical protein